MSELKLLPCPFCGREAEIISRPVYTYLKPYDPETADKKHYVQCKGCATQCGALEYDTPEEAIAAWNRRAQPENAPLTLDELRQMDGEPVWMARAKKWVFVSTVVTEPYAQVWYFFKGFVYTVLYYHEKFYRNKPGRSEG